MDARRWCSQVWCTSIKRPGSSAHGSWLRSRLSGLKMAEVSSCSGLDGALGPGAATPKTPVRDELGSHRKKKKKKTSSKLNSAAARESQTWPGKKKRRRRKKNYSKMPSFAGARERKDRCLISFSVQAVGLRGVDLLEGGFSCLHSVKVFVFVLKNIFDSYFSQPEESVINISRLSKQKQTIKLMSHKKVWKQSLLFRLYLTFWTVSSDSLFMHLLI